MHSSWVVGSDNVAGNKLLALQGVSGLIGTLWSIRANCVKAGKTACLCARVLTSQRGVTPSRWPCSTQVLPRRVPLHPRGRIAAEKPAQRRQLNSKQCTAASCSRGFGAGDISTSPVETSVSSHLMPQLPTLISRPSSRPPMPHAGRLRRRPVGRAPHPCCRSRGDAAPARARNAPSGAAQRILARYGYEAPATVQTAFRSTVILVQMEHRDWVSPIFLDRVRTAHIEMPVATSIDPSRTSENV